MFWLLHGFVTSAGSWFCLGLTLCQFGSDSVWNSIQLTSHFPSFKFPEREIWIGPIKSSGQLAMVGSGVPRCKGHTLQGWKGMFSAAVWIPPLSGGWPQVPLYWALKHSCTHPSFKGYKVLRFLGAASHFILGNHSPNSRVISSLKISLPNKKSKLTFWNAHALTGIIIKSFFFFFCSCRRLNSLFICDQKNCSKI